MKALTLWQPWASLIATGAKTWETRSWGTSYRGPLVIHASVKKDRQMLSDCLSEDEFQARLAPLQGFSLDLANPRPFGLTPDVLTFGAALCVVDLIACVQTNKLTGVDIGTDEPFGDFHPGRWAWKLENVRVFQEPIPWKGQQGLWDWSEKDHWMHEPLLPKVYGG